MSADESVIWWTAFGAVAQALGAIATFAAVGISLWISLSERALRASATGRILVTFAGDGSPGVYHVGITVENEGLRPIRVTSVGWRTGWLNRGFESIRTRYAIQNPEVMVNGQSILPATIEPSHTLTCLTRVIDMQLSEENEQRMPFFRRHFLFFDAPIRVIVHISGRKPVIGRLSKDLKLYLRTGVHAPTTNDD